MAGFVPAVTKIVYPAFATGLLTKPGELPAPGNYAGVNLIAIFREIAHLAERYVGRARPIVGGSRERFTRFGVERVIRYAFELARKTGRKRVSSATKSNGINYVFPFWDDVLTTSARAAVWTWPNSNSSLSGRTPRSWPSSLAGCGNRRGMHQATSSGGVSGGSGFGLMRQPSIAPSRCARTASGKRS